MDKKSRKKYNKVSLSRNKSATSKSNLFTFPPRNTHFPKSARRDRKSHTNKKLKRLISKLPSTSAFKEIRDHHLFYHSPSNTFRQLRRSTRNITAGTDDSPVAPNSKSIFLEINKLYANAKKGPNALKQYRSNFRQELKSSVSSENVFGEACRRIRNNSVIVDKVLKGGTSVKKRAEPEMEIQSAPVEPDTSEFSEFDMLPKNEWVFATPPKQRLGVARLEDDNDTKAAVLCTAGETSSIFQVNGDLDVGFNVCIPNQQVSLDPEFLTHLSSFKTDLLKGSHVGSDSEAEHQRLAEHQLRINKKNKDGKENVENDQLFTPIIKVPQKKRTKVRRSKSNFESVEEEVANTSCDFTMAENNGKMCIQKKDENNFLKKLQRNIGSSQDRF